MDEPSPPFGADFRRTPYLRVRFERQSDFLSQQSILSSSTLRVKRL